jgi:pyruvate carboxylase
VLSDFVAHEKRYSDVSVLPTAVFFYGMGPGEELSVDIETGKTLIIKFLTVGDPHPDGSRLVFFELNGQPREVLVVDNSLGSEVKKQPKADPNNPLEIGAPMPGLIVSVAAQEGEEVASGQKLFTLEAMKMETTVYAERAGKIQSVLVKPGSQVETGDVLMRYEG